MENQAFTTESTTAPARVQVRKARARRFGAGLALAITIGSLAPITAANAAPLSAENEAWIQQAEAPNVGGSGTSWGGNDVMKHLIEVTGDERTDRYIEGSSMSGGIKTVTLPEAARAELAKFGVTHDDAEALRLSNLKQEEVLRSGDKALSDLLRGFGRVTNGGKSVVLGFRLPDSVPADVAAAMIANGSKAENLQLNIRTTWKDGHTLSGDAQNLTLRDLVHKPSAEVGKIRQDYRLAAASTQERQDAVNFPEMTAYPTSSFYDGYPDPTNGDFKDGPIGPGNSSVIRTWVKDAYKGASAVSQERQADVTKGGTMRGHNPETLVENSTSGDRLGGWGVLVVEDAESGTAMDLTEAFEIMVASDYGTEGLGRILAADSAGTATEVNARGDKVFMTPRQGNGKGFWDASVPMTPGVTQEKVLSRYDATGIIKVPTVTQNKTTGKLTATVPRGFVMNDAETRAVVSGDTITYTQPNASAWVQTTTGENTDFTPLAVGDVLNAQQGATTHAFTVTAVEGNSLTVKAPAGMTLRLGGATLGANLDFTQRVQASVLLGGYEATYIPWVAPAPEPEPETPVTPEPETPVTPEPETPVTPEPEVPVVPETPEPETPEVPETPEPETPVKEVPPAPETPVTPETPETPEAPVVPEAPVEEVTEDEAEAPVEEVVADEAAAPEEAADDAVVAEAAPAALADTGAGKGGIVAAFGLALAGMAAWTARVFGKRKEAGSEG